MPWRILPRSRWSCVVLRRVQRGEFAGRFGVCRWRVPHSVVVGGNAALEAKAEGAAVMLSIGLNQ